MCGRYFANYFSHVQPGGLCTKPSRFGMRHKIVSLALRSQTVGIKSAMLLQPPSLVKQAALNPSTARFSALVQSGLIVAKPLLVNGDESFHGSK